MTKAEWISLVKNRLPKVDDTARFDNRLIERWISVFRNQFIHDTTRKDSSNLSFYAREYKSLTVTEDADTGIYYTTLPAVVVQLPYNQEGIVKIQSMTGTGLEFVPVDEEELELLDDMYSMDAAVNGGVVGYVLKEDRVLYDKNMTSTMATAGVKMSIIQAFESYSDDDEVVMPQGRDVEILGGVVNMMMGIPPKDLTLDNAS